MLDEVPTTADLLIAWRDASRAAELTRRLARVGDMAEATTKHDDDAAAQVAALVEMTVQDATEAVAIAQGTAERMHRAARVSTRSAAATLP